MVQFKFFIIQHINWYFFESFKYKNGYLIAKNHLYTKRGIYD